MSTATAAPTMESLNQAMRLPIDDAVLEVQDEGSGAPAVLMLHPFPLAAGVWDETAATLSKRTRVIRLDLRGLGASGAPPGPYLMEALAGDVAAVLDALRVERAIVVGNSLGVMVALAFYRMFAERVLALALICGRAGADDPPTVRARNDLAANVEREGSAALVASHLGRLFAPQTYTEQPALIERARLMIEASDPRGAAAVLRGMALRVDSADLLDEIGIPVSVIAGVHDQFISVPEMRALAGAITGASFDLLDCGHVPELEVPLALTALLEQLIGVVQCS
ncbi:MAG TPA: alpha/beta hydrolase [Candidatus Baltobacteraceae bacterium]